MKYSDIVTYLIYLILPIIELILNYNATYFPEFHEARIKFDICAIFVILIPFMLIISILCGPFCLCIYSISLIIFSLAALYYAIVSFYLYFAYNGGERIKSTPIRILLWISFINFLINLLSSCCCTSPSSQKENKEYCDIELDEKTEPLV